MSRVAPRVRWCLGLASGAALLSPAPARAIDGVRWPSTATAHRADPLAAVRWPHGGWSCALSRDVSGTARSGISPAWTRALGGTSRTGRFMLAFVAGFLMLMGARIADGCTSGHGISGIAQLAIGSFLAVGAMFAGGIATAMLLRRV